MSVSKYYLLNTEILKWKRDYFSFKKQVLCKTGLDFISLLFTKLKTDGASYRLRTWKRSVSVWHKWDDFKSDPFALKICAQIWFVTPAQSCVLQGLRCELQVGVSKLEVGWTLMLGCTYLTFFYYLPKHPRKLPARSYTTQATGLLPPLNSFPASQTTIT